MIVAEIYRITTLSDGKISVILHVPFEHAAAALALHPLMNKPVKINVEGT